MRAAPPNIAARATAHVKDFQDRSMATPWNVLRPHDELIVRHGLVRQRIELAAITQVVPTRSPMSSPALSLDRLRITFGSGMFKRVMISPADKARFLSELALRARLVRKDDALVRL